MKKIKIIALLTLPLVLGFLFISIKQKSTRSWMGEQIKADLSDFSKEDLNPIRLETTFNYIPSGMLVVHFQIIDQKLYWKKNWEGQNDMDRVRKVCGMLNHLCKTTKVANVDFLMTMHDGVLHPLDQSGQSKYLPMFSFAKRQNVQAILFPDPLTENFVRRTRKHITLAKWVPKYQWRNKKEIAFWRGATTGGDFTLDNWYEMPRTKLSLLSAYYPDQIDAGYTSLVAMPQVVKEEILKTLPIVDWVNHKRHLKYKYLVIADGNTCTYPRYYLGLYSGSVVFKDESVDIQWFYKELKPYVHYIPVASDFSDLPEKVQWAKEHDKEAKKIAQNATAFINHNLKLKHIYAYIGELLNEYAKLQDQPIELQDGMQPYLGSHKTKWRNHE